MGGMKRGAVLALHRNNDEDTAFDGNLTQTPLTINSDATVTNEDASLVWLGGDGTDIVKTTATVDSSIKELVITMFDDGAGDEVFVATDNASLVFGPALKTGNDKCLFKLQAGTGTKVTRTVMEHSGAGSALSIWHQNDNGGDGVFTFSPSTFIFGLSTDTSNTFILHDWWAGDGSNAQSLRLKFSGSGRKAQFLNPLLFQFGPEAQGTDEDCAMSIQAGDATNVVKTSFIQDSSAKTLQIVTGSDSAGDDSFTDGATTILLGSTSLTADTDTILRFHGGTGAANASIDLTYDASVDTLKGSGGGFSWEGTTGGTPTSGAGTRLMWIPAKGAFRVGSCAGTQWDDGSVGANSTVIGVSGIASGSSAFVVGAGIASNSGSVSLMGGTASGAAAFTLGAGVTASGTRTFAFGRNLTQSTPDTINFGLNDTSSSVPALLITGLRTAGSDPLIRVSEQVSTGLTTTTEVPSMDLDLSATVTWATGAITSQRAIKIQAPTYAFDGASTITNAATLYIDAAPTAGTNATITNNYALWVDDGATRLDGDFEHGGTNFGVMGTTPAPLQTAITQTFSTASTTSAALTAATLTDNSGGAATDNTIGAITNANNAGSADVVPTADAIAELAEEINALRVDVLNAKSVQTTIIDHLQTFGLEQ